MKKSGLLLTLLMSASVLINCASTKYTVTFDSDGGTSIPAQEIEENKCVEKPANPTRTPEPTITYIFGEWQLDGKPYDFATPVTHDITLVATWISSTRLYTINFDTGEGGCAVESQNVEYEGHATKPEGDITRESTAQYDFEFTGEWQLDGKTYDFDIPVTQDITLVAKWKETLREYTVYFDSQGGIDPINPQTIKYGEYATDPGAPTHKESDAHEYTFIEWQ